MGRSLRNGLIFAVHGFLGRGEDFGRIQELLSISELNFYAPSLFKRNQSLSEENSFSEILLNQFDLFKKSNPSFKKKIFLGYSFGSRIGLKLLQKNEDLFDEWIFLSCNPGFSEEDVSSRNQRIASDLTWSESINENNWTEFLKKWNSQPVFSGANHQNLNIFDYDLNLLKRALTEESLGLQKDYRQLIAKNRDRIHWLVGSHDKKFSLMGQSLFSSGIIKNLIVLEAGHRIHLEAPHEVSELILNLLN